MIFTFRGWFTGADLRGFGGEVGRWSAAAAVVSECAAHAGKALQGGLAGGAGVLRIVCSCSNVHLHLLQVKVP